MKLARGLIGLCLTWALATPLWSERDRTYQDPRFLEALRCLDESKFAKAREIAERMLAEDPKSYTATYIMGRVYYYGEGSIPRAYHSFKLAKEELEAKWGRGKIPNDGPWMVHSAIWQQLIWSAMQMEHYEEEIQLIQDFDKAYQPSMAGQLGWPMLKLGRVEEARERMKMELKGAKDPVQRSHVVNTLGNLEFEADNMAESYQYFLQLCKEMDHGSDMDPVFWANAGEAARDLLRFDDAEKHLIDATKRFSQYTFADPWRFLAELYVSQGRLPEALQALKKMQTWRLSCSPQVAQNKWADCLSTAGIVLLSLGYDKQAYNIFDRLTNRPDRNSGISTKPSLMEGRNLYFCSLAMRAYRQRLLEERSWSAWKAWVPMTLSILHLEQRLRLTEAHAASLLAGGTGIPDLLRPFGPRALDRPWLAPGLWRLFGPGPVAVAARYDMEHLKPAQEPQKIYLQSVLGEALAVRGQYKEAETLFAQLLRDLPPREMALRTRIQANMVRILEGQSRNQEALHYLRQVMEHDPSLLRQFELRLPIQWNGGGGLADDALGRLKGSPRFRVASGAFVAEIQSDGNTLSARVLGPDGTVLKNINTRALKTPEETIVKFCQDFHEEVFAPVLDLSQADIYSIDSSPSAVSGKKFEEMIKP